MRYLTHLMGLGSIAGLGLLAGCNETTRDDVVAKRDNVATEQRKLDDAKRNAARDVNQEKQEANAARVTNKPIVGDDVNEGAAEESREAQQKKIDSQKNVQDQAQRVEAAKQDVARTEETLEHEQARDKFLIDCKASIDLANRAIEKLETKQNAADEAGKAELQQQISKIKTHRDEVQRHINDIRQADVLRWSDHKAAAMKSLESLNQETQKVS